ncbi:hypothetical protein AAE478_008553 [Parahypoxylon ruwenzoriense]
MVGLLRLPQPWLFSQLRSRAPSRIISGVHRSISTTAARSYNTIRRKDPRKSASQRTRSSNKEQFVPIDPSASMLLPYTFVAPPIRRYPRKPAKFVHMLWLNVKNRWQTLFSIISMKFMSQPTPIFSRPRFQFNLSAVVPTAKVLHSQMSEALALGDKETLRSICTPELFETLGATIDSRPKGMRADWELVRYDRSLLYPRVADWRATYQPLQDGSSKLIKQAVVTISSIQRIARYDDSRGGIKIAGSERVRTMTEHIVIQATVDRNTFESSPWKVWGTLSEMKYEEYKAYLENIEALSNEMET